jgi:hypothetical protein
LPKVTELLSDNGGNPIRQLRLQLHPSSLFLGVDTAATSMNVTEVVPCMLL